jgi:hypothetical protein
MGDNPFGDDNPFLVRLSSAAAAAAATALWL